MKSRYIFDPPLGEVYVAPLFIGTTLCSNLLVHAPRVATAWSRMVQTMRDVVLVLRDCAMTRKTVWIEKWPQP